MGDVRWYTTKDIPSFSFVRLANGNFLTVDQSHDSYKQLYQFDTTGRVFTVYVLDNDAHHSVQQTANGNVILASEYTGLRPGEDVQDATVEDGASVIDLSTGLEVAYYAAHLRGESEMERAI
ncbi:MAG: aryl-sulfate sulfotransferase [Lachnospiraceae bacterium]|nr:aryl-sulfate sulfotransferase [Lachnospiraceae bacterium]